MDGMEPQKSPLYYLKTTKDSCTHKLSEGHTIISYAPDQIAGTYSLYHGFKFFRIMCSHISHHRNITNIGRTYPLKVINGLMFRLWYVYTPT